MMPGNVSHRHSRHAMRGCVRITGVLTTGYAMVVVMHPPRVEHVHLQQATPRGLQALLRGRPNGVKHAVHAATYQS